MPAHMLLVELKRGRVLQVLNGPMDIQHQPEIFSFTKGLSDGPFFPVQDSQNDYNIGDIVEVEILIVEGNIFEEVVVVEKRSADSDVTEFEDKANPRMVILGIIGVHQVGDKIRLQQ